MFGCDCCCSVSSLVYLVGLFTIASKVIPFLVKKYKGNKPAELQEKNFKKDTVYLYQFPGTPTSSSLSPFCIKIEAFCRLHNIKFERRNTLSERGSNNLLPFIELNGEVHSDSQIILRRITQIFKLKAYPDEQTASIGHAVDRFIDNHTFNIILMGKSTVFGKCVGVMAGDKVPSFLLPIVEFLGGKFGGNMLFTRAATSVGKFKEAEQRELLRNDLLQLQTILGKKKFLLGEEPTLVDCTAFGQFGSHYYAVPSARFYLHDVLESSEFAPLKDYAERAKNRLFGNEFCDKK
ncbi:cdr-4 [Pristionchus pacificus]|nr:cdr-4 [Pristionchus pacificus]